MERSASFNPRPARESGATGKIVNRHRIGNRFNPRPARESGATPISCLLFVKSSRFNPRPARESGATRSSMTARRCAQVSIRAPLVRAGRRNRTGRTPRWRRFQSAPRS